MARPSWPLPGSGPRPGGKKPFPEQRAGGSGPRSPGTRGSRGTGPWISRRSTPSPVRREQGADGGPCRRASARLVGRGDVAQGGRSTSGGALCAPSRSPHCRGSSGDLGGGGAARSRQCTSWRTREVWTAHANRGWRRQACAAVGRARKSKCVVPEASGTTSGPRAGSRTGRPPSTMTELDEVWRDGADDGRLVRRQVALERRIRDRSRNLEGENRAPDCGRESRRTSWLRASGTPHWSRVHRARGQYSCCQRGVRTSSSPRPRRDRPPPRGVGAGPVRPAAAGDVEGQDRRVDAASAMLQGAATTFDDLLLRPLAAQLRDRPLVLVPTGALQSIPWSVLPWCLG